MINRTPDSRFLQAANSGLALSDLSENLAEIKPPRTARTSPGAALKPVEGVRRRRLRHVPGYAQPRSAAAPVIRESIPTADIPRLVNSWIMDGEAAGWSPRNVEHYRFITGKLVWWLTSEKHPECGVDELRGFLLYARTAHSLPDGRWGGSDPDAGPRWTKSSQRFKPLSASSVRNYWRNLRAFFNWLVGQRKLDRSPLEMVKEPIERSDEIRPFTTQEIRKLLDAAKSSYSPARDAAIILFLLDTGMRVSEVCALQYRDVDFDQRTALIRQGKGGKDRSAYWSADTQRALVNYVGPDGREPDNPLFVSENGPTMGAALTRRGLAKMIQKLGAAAGLATVRCSPHTFRHTFATMYLLAGGDAFSLQQRLGHENPAMTQKYVQFAKADMAVQARQFSPVAAMKQKRK